jgi:tetratricopeptide (TPR) repeat protein
MKKNLATLLLLALSMAANAQIKTPAPSPGQTIKQDFGLSTIELSYSRPSAKGRKIFGDLVPFGKVWRTGANGATTLTFGDEVIIGNTKIPAGKYGLLSIPEETSWTLIITKQTDVTSPAAYKPEEDVVRVSVKANKVPMKAETFTMQFANVKAESCELHIRWDDAAVALPIKTDIEGKIMASIEASMKSEKPAYAQAASYYLENGKDIQQAVIWYEKAVALQPNAFWLKYQLARAYAKAGKKDLAKKTSLESIELAKQAKNDDYVQLNNKLLSELK